MRLSATATYVIISTNPTNPASMKIGDIVGLRLCEPGGEEFRLSVRLTELGRDGSFQGTTFTTDRAQVQHVGGSFLNPRPDLHSR